MAEIVLVGAGHAHVEVLRRFARAPIEGARLTLLTPAAHAAYSGMVPGLVEGVYAPREVAIDAARLAALAGARFIEGEAAGLDLGARRVLVDAREPVPFDILSINAGSRPTPVPGSAEHAVPVKPVAAFLPGFAALHARLLARGGGSIAVVGGGAGGTELALALERRLRRDLPGPSALTLICGRDGLLPGFPTAFRRKVGALLAARGIARIDASARAVAPGRVELDDGRALPADEIVWATHAAPPAWLERTGLPRDERGFLRVDATLRVLGQAHVFAAGDSASFGPRALPKSGVYAVRAGPVLADNLRAAATGGAPRPFAPQRHTLYILGTGEGTAIGTRNGLTLSGRLVWRVKRWLDARFLARYPAA